MSRLQKLLSGFARRIEILSEWSGNVVSWLTLLMVLLVFLVVILRYVLNVGSIPIQESITYLHGMVFLLGAGYTLKQDEHVRVDVFYSVMSHERKAWVDLLGNLIFLYPVCLYIFFMSLDYVLLSWKINEASVEAGGLPGLYVLKSLILAMPVLLMLQGTAGILRSTLFLFFNAPSPYASSLNELTSELKPENKPEHEAVV